MYRPGRIRLEVLPNGCSNVSAMWNAIIAVLSMQGCKGSLVICVC